MIIGPRSCGVLGESAVSFTSTERMDCKVHDGSGTYNGMKDRLEVGLEVDVDGDGGGEEKKRLRGK